ncbi:MAG: hypothetical protein AAGI44_02005 [Pseudomonadota bacterium]
MDIAGPTNRLLSRCALIALITALPALKANSQGVSPGCEFVNLVGSDRFTTGLALGSRQFFAGEAITIIAGPPVGDEGSQTPTNFEFTIDGQLIDTAPFPGELNYLIEEDVVAAANVDVLPSGSHPVTWNISCRPSSPSQVPALPPLFTLLLFSGLCLLGAKRLARAEGRYSNRG